LEYYQVVKRWLEQTPGESIVDVGCGGCPVATWGDFKKRKAINLQPFPEIPGVENVVANWLDYEMEPVSVITCLQVLEHLEDDVLFRFKEKIFDNCDKAIISVPYKWEKGLEPSHVQDPIDLRKFLGMVGKEPVRMRIASHRMVCFFNNQAP
jgi:hypothetical protein